MFSETASLLYARGNEAIQLNPPTGSDFHITSHGSDWLWTVFSLFALATLIVVGFSFTKSKNERLFYHLSSIALFVLSIQYFTLASNLGWTEIQAEFNHVQTSDQLEVPGLRQVFYAKWVGYFLAFPAFLVNYAALVGLTWSTAIFTVAAQEITIVSFLIGMLIQSTYKWGYFTFGAISFIFVAFSLLFSYRKAAQENDSAVSTHSTIISSASTLLLFLYPIAWALSEGGNVIQPDSEAVFYGVLDLCFFLIVGAYFHWVASKVNFEQRGISGFQNKVFASQPAQQHYISEKVAVVAPAVPAAVAEIPRASDDTAAAAQV